MVKNLNNSKGFVTSFTAARSIPYKIVLDSSIVESITKDKYIPPVHIQLCPTNACNLNCSFCSCSARDKEQQLDYKELLKFMTKAQICGCKSVTITGGGEPLMYPHINDLICELKEMGIKIGLVSNGLLLHKLNEEALQSCVWIRISFADNRKFEGKFQTQMKYAVKKAPKVDWAFSYVVSKDVNYNNLAKIIEFANKYKFTHVRVVQDLFEPENISMETIRRMIELRDLDLSRAIFQDRSVWVGGCKDCRICLLKPTVAADGYIYPCCGTQYALRNPGKDFEKQMRICHINDFYEWVHKQIPFDGSICVKCYYQGYNDILRLMVDGIKHVEFV